MRETYSRNRRVMSFGEYLDLLRTEMPRQTRSAAQYVRDVFDYFGTTTVHSSRGELIRYRLFDCPWDNGKESLKGQEEVQSAIYRLISNFSREGRTNRLILLHGPNGSAKSTLVACIERAMEYYSYLDEGALYRFRWIFPKDTVVKGGIGFGERKGSDGTSDFESYATLDDEFIEARIGDELRDHPLLLLPKSKRLELVEMQFAEQIQQGFRPARFLTNGDLSHRNRQIFEALLGLYHGDAGKVFRHVQVERFFISRRYRQSVATVEPAMSVDAHARQISMDRSLSTLPSVLQSVSLFELSGELVDANRGILDFEDLLKRPFESWKYLLGVVEDGSTSLDVGSVEVDTVFLATSNDVFLAAFKEVPEFQSFKGRMELVRTPYLLDYRVEKAIYDEHLEGGLAAGVGRHVAPHVTWTLSLWAVLSRLHRPKPDRYQGRLAELLARLGPVEKAKLYADQPIDSLSHDDLKELRAGTETIARETENEENYEGRVGASPREMKLLLMNAAQSPDFRCVSPFAVLKGLETLVEEHSVYEFLRQTPSPGGYHEHAVFVNQVRFELLRRIADEVRISMGLVDERRYIEHFERYITHVSYWIKHEKIPNPVTHIDETPDEEFMADVERIIGVVSSGSKILDYRHEVITRIGAWSLDHRGQRPDYEQIFPRPIADLREAFFNERKRQVNQISTDLLIYLVDGPQKLRPEDCGLVQTTLNTLKTRFNYCDDCAKDAVLALLKKG